MSVNVINYMNEWPKIKILSVLFTIFIVSQIQVSAQFIIEASDIFTANYVVVIIYILYINHKNVKEKYHCC